MLDAVVIDGVTRALAGRQDVELALLYLRRRNMLTPKVGAD